MQGLVKDLYWVTQGRWSSLRYGSSLRAAGVLGGICIVRGAVLPGMTLARRRGYRPLTPFQCRNAILNYYDT